MDETTTPFSRCRYEQLPAWMLQLRYEQKPGGGVTRAGGDRADGDDLLVREIRAAFDHDARAHRVRDLDPSVVRDAVITVEDRCAGRWTVVGVDSDVFAALDAHFEPEQRRLAAAQREQQESMAANAEGGARVVHEAALRQAAAERRVWGLPELQPEPPPGVAA